MQNHLFLFDFSLYTFDTINALYIFYITNFKEMPCMNMCFYWYPSNLLNITQMAGLDTNEQATIKATSSTPYKKYISTETKAEWLIKFQPKSLFEKLQLACHTKNTWATSEQHHVVWERICVGASSSCSVTERSQWDSRAVSQKWSQATVLKLFKSQHRQRSPLSM